MFMEKIGTARVKAGALAGLFSALFSVFLLFLGTINAPRHFSSPSAFQLVLEIIPFIVYWIFVGGLFGAFFSKIPTRSTLSKAVVWLVVISLVRNSILFLKSDVEHLATLPTGGFNLSLLIRFFAMEALTILGISIILGFLSGVIFGLVYKFLYGRMGETQDYPVDRNVG